MPFAFIIFFLSCYVFILTGEKKFESLSSVLIYWQVFVGLGFPYEGPAPLEAIANGCFFINPKVSNVQFHKEY